MPLSIGNNYTGIPRLISSIIQPLHKMGIFRSRWNFLDCSQSLSEYPAMAPLTILSDLLDLLGLWYRKATGWIDWIRFYQDSCRSLKSSLLQYRMEFLFHHDKFFWTTWSWSVNLRSINIQRLLFIGLLLISLDNDSTRLFQFANNSP